MADSSLSRSGTPRVSVLLTTYNGSRCVDETLDSVLAQSFTDFELVVVDDASTDDTVARVAARTDPRIRLLRAPANLGVVGARNHGFAALRGAYVATIDHDDLWRPERLARGVAILDAEPRTSMVATRIAALTSKGLVTVPRPGDHTPVLLRWRLLMDCPLAYSSLLFRRELAALPAGGFVRPELRYADDYELMLRLANAGDAAYLDEALTLYRWHATNTTHSVGDEMYQHAAHMLAEAYQPWLGKDAPMAGFYMAWHIARRQPLADTEVAMALAANLTRLRDGFLASQAPNAADTRAVRTDAAEAFWRPVRASLRRGCFGPLSAMLRWPGLVPLRSRAGDIVVSLGVGLARRLLRSDGRVIAKLPLGGATSS